MSPSGQSTADLLQRALQFHQRNDLANAQALYEAVLAFQPEHPDALHLLGVVYGQLSSPGRGIALIERALNIAPGLPGALANLARMKFEAGDFSGAEKSFREALKAQPDNAHMLNSLGICYRETGRPELAVPVFERAIRAAPAMIEPYLNLCNAYKETCQPEKIIGLTAAAAAAGLESPDLWLHGAEAWFDAGDLRNGWRHYEHRFESRLNPAIAQHYDLPFWQGEALEGKKILIWTEQAPGDEILFSSMLPDIAAAAACCVVQCSARLVALFGRSFPQIAFTSAPPEQAVLDGMDFQSPLGSLGRWLRPDFAAFPHRQGYLRADPDAVEGFKRKYRQAGAAGPLVGIAWRSSGIEAARSKTISLDAWGPVFAALKATFVNLQYGDCSEDLALAKLQHGVDVLQDETVDPLRDMDAHAAQIAALDLVVTTSNTAAHVAGALGTPTVCMHPRVLGLGRRWYWFADKTPCPWYPSVRQVVQSGAGEWHDVIVKAADAARKILAGAQQ